MKKLIIVAAIAAGALVSQAASFDWTTSAKAYSIADATIGAGLAAGTTYGVGNKNADSMSNQITSRSAVWTYVMTLTCGTETDTISGSLVAGDFASRMVQENGLSSSIWDLKSGEDSRTVNYSIVLTGTLTDGLDKSWTITSDTITGSKTYAGVGDISFASAGPTQWTTAGSSVPEPTSGLLMLVGLAGLALRRPRAESGAIR